MKSKSVRFGRGFKVLLGNQRVQAAQMVIQPGDSEGGLRTGITVQTNGCSSCQGQASQSSTADVTH